MFSFIAYHDSTLPPTQILTINNTGSETLKWSLSDNADWLYVSPSSDISNHTEVSVSVNTTHLNLGTYTAAILITSTNANNSPQTVNVSYRVVAPLVPIVLVHGWLGAPSDFDVMKSRLENEGFPYVWPVQLEACGAPEEAGFDDSGDINPLLMFKGNAQHLDDFIDSNLNALPDSISSIITKIDIIAYDMGGLIARRYLNPIFSDGWSPFPVRNIILLGTPNNGSEWGSRAAAEIRQALQSVCDDSDHVAWKELGPEEMLVFNQEFPYLSPAESKYVSVYGTRGCSNESLVSQDCSWFGSRSLFCPHDGMTAKRSAVGAVRNNYNDDITYLNNYAYDVCHSKLCTDQIVYDSCIKQIFLNQPVISAPDAMNGDSAEPQICFQLADSLTVGATDSGTFIVEPGAELLVQCAALDSLPNFTLRSPSGIQFNSSSSLPDSSILYQSEPGYAAYYFTTAEAGVWQWYLSNGTSTAFSVPYEITAVANSPLSVRSSQSSDYVNTDDTLGLRVIASFAGTPVTGLHILAQPIVNKFDTEASVLLLDDGFHDDLSANDGTYGVRLTGITHGPTRFHISVTGSVTGGDVHRTVDRFALVASGCCVGVRGNVNSQGGINILDLAFLINYLFRSGLAPSCVNAANVNGTGGISISDLTYLVNFLFRNGAPPPACP